MVFKISCDIHHWHHVLQHPSALQKSSHRGEHHLESQDVCVVGLPGERYICLSRHTHKRYRSKCSVFYWGNPNRSHPGKGSKSIQSSPKTRNQTWPKLRSASNIKQGLDINHRNKQGIYTQRY